MKNVKGIQPQLVIGLGEVGAAVKEVLQCDGHDPFRGIVAEGRYDVIHICFPHNQALYDFASEVKKYEKQFSAGLTVIHSTVPIGTTKKIGAVHSPVRGVHPNLADGVRTFVKFFGGERAKDAAKLFEEKGVKTYATRRSEDTEAGKLWDTTQYGVMILLNKEIHQFCDEHGLDFDVVYKMFNQTYNDGYRALGRSEVARPYLKYMEGPIGGHCVVPNAKLFRSPATEKILKENMVLEASGDARRKAENTSVAK